MDIPPACGDCARILVCIYHGRKDSGIGDTGVSLRAVADSRDSALVFLFGCMGTGDRSSAFVSVPCEKGCFQDKHTPYHQDNVLGLHSCVSRSGDSCDTDPERDLSEYILDTDHLFFRLYLSPGARYIVYHLLGGGVFQGPRADHRDTAAGGSMDHADHVGYQQSVKTASDAV